MRAGVVPLVTLIAAGAAWGLSVPLMRVAAGAELEPMGLVLIQTLAMVAGVLVLLRLAGLPLPDMRRHARLFLLVAVFGAVLPGYVGFLSAAHLPAGIRAIITAAVPMFTLPLAIAAGQERPDARRALGVLLGALAITIIAWPDAAAPAAATSFLMVLVAAVAPLSYGIEATYLAARGPGGLHPFQLLFGASCCSVLLSAPIAALTGQLPDPFTSLGGAAGVAVLATGLLNVAAYSAYFWLIGRAGSVFASQVGYLVTLFGVAWSMLLLGERYGPSVWIAFILVLIGVALVQPRPVVPLEPA